MYCFITRKNNKAGRKWQSRKSEMELIMIKPTHPKYNGKNKDGVK